MLVARYQVRLKDNNGIQRAIFDSWRNLQWRYEVNGDGFYSFTMDGNDSRAALFEPDGQIEVWRSIPGVLAWGLVFEAHIEDYYETLFENGNYQFVSVGSGYTGLLARRVIAYYKGTAQSLKTGVAETVMKEYVDENAGPGATTPPRLLASGVTAGLTIEPDSGAGAAWTGDRSTKNLLEVCQEIALFGAVDFAVVGTGAATYEFRVYDAQLGVNRTNIGLNPATGLNAAGYPPVVFSAEMGNVARMDYSMKRKPECNAIYIWGQGSGIARDVAERENAAGVAISPVGKRERSRSGASQASGAAAELETIGDADLENLQAQEKLDFTPKQSPGCLYGVHYNVGDRVTGKTRSGLELNKRLVAVQATVSAGGGGESLDLTFADVP